MTGSRSTRTTSTSSLAAALQWAAGHHARGARQSVHGQGRRARLALCGGAPHLSLLQPRRVRDAPLRRLPFVGIFYRLVPDWWIVQVLSGTRGDLEKSLAWHEKSVQCKPVIQNYKELAATQYCLYTKSGDEAMRVAGMHPSTRGLPSPPPATPRAWTIGICACFATTRRSRAATAETGNRKWTKRSSLLRERVVHAPRAPDRCTSAPCRAPLGGHND